MQRTLAETTSFDTIGNAFYSRNDHCSLAGWRRLLVITSEFHLARTRLPSTGSTGRRRGRRGPTSLLSWHRGHGPDAGRGHCAQGARRVDAKRRVELAHRPPKIVVGPRALKG